jgi:hypothetical protein
MPRQRAELGWRLRRRAGRDDFVRRQRRVSPWAWEVRTQAVRGPPAVARRARLQRRAASRARGAQRLRGTCTGSSAVSCPAADACHVTGTCDTSTGSCTPKAAPNGTVCSDGNACTQGDSCQAGKCTAGAVIGTTVCSGTCVDTNTDPEQLRRLRATLPFALRLQRRQMRLLDQPDPVPARRLRGSELRSEQLWNLRALLRARQLYPGRVRRRHPEQHAERTR